MISKVEMVKELGDVELELALRQELKAMSIVRDQRELLIKDIASGTRNSNPSIKLGNVIYNIVLKLMD